MLYWVKWWPVITEQSILTISFIINKNLFSNFQHALQQVNVIFRMQRLRISAVFLWNYQKVKLCRWFVIWKRCNLILPLRLQQFCKKYNQLVFLCYIELPYWNQPWENGTRCFLAHASLLCRSQPSQATRVVKFFCLFPLPALRLGPFREKKVMSDDEKSLEDFFAKKAKGKKQKKKSKFTTSDTITKQVGSSQKENEIKSKDLSGKKTSGVTAVPSNPVSA